MRTTIALAVLLLFACSKTESGEEYARKQAAEADKDKVIPKVIKVETPVPGGVTIPCDKLIDAAAFGTAIGEVEPIIVSDQTKSSKEAAAVCSIMRGGKKLTKAETDKLLETKNRLGVLPGDPICYISTFCWSAENDAKFKEKCPSTGGAMDTSLGFEACVKVFEVGADNINQYRFIDSDTRCLFEVRGGPSMIDNNVIANCARTAQSMIGLEQIKVQ